jgi:hypothetical protein
MDIFLNFDRHLSKRKPGVPPGAVNVRLEKRRDLPRGRRVCVSVEVQVLGEEPRASPARKRPRLAA